MKFQDFVHMSGYGGYVWSAYALWLAVVIWNVWSAVRLRATVRERALRRAAAATARPAPGPAASNSGSNELSEEGV